MDYKYIEQLLERYWQCQTTLEEENILRAFFSQEDLPETLARYRALFVYEAEATKEAQLSEDFDQKLCERLGIDSEENSGHKEEQTEAVKARRISLSQRLRPLYNAAAAVAVVSLLGTGVQHIFSGRDTQTEWDYNAGSYQDSYNNPQEAYETLSDGIEELRNVLGTSKSDSLRSDSLNASVLPN